MAHPNGHTSVYGHLQKFAPDIEAYIKKVQYEKQSYEVEVFPALGELEVDKGQIIAYSGNTGSSSGPHLHFEIRKSATEKPTNPLLYGYEVADATPPTLQKIFAYPLSENAHVNGSGNKVQLTLRRQTDGSYLADAVDAMGTIGIGFLGYDRQDLAANKNGVYQVTLKKNGTPISAFGFNTFSFYETRYINTMIDYEHYGKYRQRILKCFRAPGNKVGLYKTLENDGKIVVKNKLNYNLELAISDFEGNTTTVTIPVKGAPRGDKKRKIVEKTPYLILADKPNNFELGTAKVYFPANTFYNDFFIELDTLETAVKIHQNTVPAHRNFTLTFDVSSIPEEDRAKCSLADWIVGVFLYTALHINGEIPSLHGQRT